MDTLYIFELVNMHKFVLVFFFLHSFIFVANIYLLTLLLTYPLVPNKQYQAGCNTHQNYIN